LVLALATATTTYLRTGAIDTFTFGLCIGLAALVMIRQVVALQDNMRLGRQLTETVADLRTSQEQLRHMAFHDQLTGLANRAHFHRTGEALFAPGPAAELPIAVIFIDLDHFKPVNDRLGHAAGDELLSLVAERLREGVREKDMIARLGGDEFAVLFTDVPSDDGVQVVANRLRLSLGQPFTLRGELITIGASVGAVIEADRNGSFGSLVARADLAMYEAKSKRPARPPASVVGPTSV
jgi:diguanylate cyclase (GGDEF)-like protein